MQLWMPFRRMVYSQWSAFQPSHCYHKRLNTLREVRPILNLPFFDASMVRGEAYSSGCVALGKLQLHALSYHSIMPLQAAIQHKAALIANEAAFFASLAFASQRQLAYYVIWQQ